MWLFLPLLICLFPGDTDAHRSLKPKNYKQCMAENRSLRKELEKYQDVGHNHGGHGGHRGHDPNHNHEVPQEHCLSFNPKSMVKIADISPKLMNCSAPISNNGIKWTVGKRFAVTFTLSRDNATFSIAFFNGNNDGLYFNTGFRKDSFGMDMAILFEHGYKHGYTHAYGCLKTTCLNNSTTDKFTIEFVHEGKNIVVSLNGRKQLPYNWTGTTADELKWGSVAINALNGFAICTSPDTFNYANIEEIKFC